MQQQPLNTDLDIRPVTLGWQGQAIQGQWWYPAGAAPDTPAIILLHEALGAISMWGSFPAILATHSQRPVFAYDRFGYGQSAADPGKRPLDYLTRYALDELPTIINQLKLATNPILLGHSDGGTIALLYAAQHPCHAVITEAAHVHVDALTRQGIRDAVAYWQQSDWRDKLAKHHGSKTSWVFAAWHETWSHPGFQNWNIGADITNPGCPILVIQGKQDQYGLPDQVDAIVAATSPWGEACFLEACAHIPHREARDALLAAISRFFAAHQL